MKKRFLIILSAAVLFVSLLPITAFAAPGAPAGFVNITFLREDSSKIMIQENQQTVFSELVTKYRNKSNSWGPLNHCDLQR